MILKSYFLLLKLIKGYTITKQIMKHITNKLILWLLLVSSTNFLYAQKVAGFFPDWVASSKVDEVQYDKLTDIYFAFMKPATNGTISTTTAGSESKILVPLATNCQKNGVRLHLSVGGANHSGNFSTVISTSANRTRFVNSVATWIEKHKLDGVNIDWEFPSATHATNLTLLMKELKTKLNALEITMGKNLELSAAVAPLVWNSDGINEEFISYCDFIHVMAFDAGGNCCVCSGNQHSSYETAERALQKWTIGLASTCGGSSIGKKVPTSKLVLAIPFYSGSPYVGYNAFSGNNPAQYFDDEDGIVGSYDFNSRPMIEKKVKLIMEEYQGAGVWAWELSQDRSDEYSLLGVMWNSMQPYMKKCEIAEPNLGQNVSICGTNSVQLKSNVASDGKLTFTWFKGNQQVTSSKIATNYTTTSAGIYKVVISDGTCEKESSVEVLGTLPNLNLGQDINLCNPIEAILDAGVQGNAISYVWTKNTKIITSAKSQTLKVTEAGIYNVSISATNCGSKSDEIVVTSSLLAVQGNEVCKSEKALIKVLEDNGPYEWFTSENATNAVFEGIEYEVSPTQNTTYFVQKKETFLEKVVGPTGNSKFTTAQSLSHFNYQKIEVKSDLTLQTVKFKAGTQGSYAQIKLLDGSKAEIASSVAQQYAANQEVTITFNEVLKAGTYYFTSQQWGGTVKYNATSSTYTEENVMTIYPEEDYTTTPTGKYGFLYDITVKAGFKNTCAKTPVNVIVDQNCQTCVNPEATITTTNLGYCEGDNGLKLTAKSVTNATYEWYKGNTKIGSNRTVSNVTKGSYSVKVIVGECESTSIKKTVVENTVVSVITTQVLTYKEGENGLTLEAQQEANHQKYVWNKGVLIVGENKPMLENALQGTYFLEVTSKETCRKVSQEVTVTEIPNKKPSIKITSPATQSIVLVNEPIAFEVNASDSDGQVQKVTYVITNTDTKKSEIIIEDKAPFGINHTFTTKGNYSIIATATDNQGGIASNEIMLTVTIATSVVDTFKEKGLKVYPNPTNQLTTIEYSLDETQNVQIHLINILGNEVEKILDEEQNTGKQSIQLDVSNLPSGIYFIQFHTQNETINHKLIVE